MEAVIAGGRGVPGRGGQREKNWDNCNSIINKIYFKNVNKRAINRLLSPVSHVAIFFFLPYHVSP